MTRVGENTMKIENHFRGNRFELVRAIFEKVGRNDMMLERMRSKEPIEVATVQSMTVAALNSLPLRQRLVNYTTQTEGDKFAIDMYVENML
jgi:hypothetical protein